MDYKKGCGYMGFQINTVRGQIGIETQKGQMNIQQPKGEQSIEQIPAKMEIDREAPKVIIDQYQCFAEAGLKNIEDLMKEHVQLSKQATMKAIARIAADGNRLAEVQNDMPSAIPELAEKNSWTEQKQFGFDLIPKSRPKIDVTGHLNIHWNLNGAKIDYRPQKPIVDIQKNKVNIYMKQWPSIDIRYVDERL